MKVYFIGAGPGAPDLLTLRGKKLVEEAAVVLYAGSLVNPEILTWARKDSAVHDTSALDLDRICSILLEHRDKPGTVARLHTGDPSLYGAIGEQIRFCDSNSIEWEVVPGVSSFSAAAAALGRELTLPGISQTVILTRKEGRTPVPPGQSLQELSRSRSTLVLFLTSAMAEEAMAAIEPSYGGDTPVKVVYRASWPDQKVLDGTVATIALAMKKAGIDRQALILVGKVLEPGDFENSKLYDPHFSHGYRDKA
jgi:precorrin-4/cobalt-precorrin-4 C11-methyltransferase